jgi:hypothetical protein
MQISEIQIAEEITEEVTELEQPDQIREVQTAEEVTEEVTELEQPIQIREVQIVEEIPEEVAEEEAIETVDNKENELHEEADSRDKEQGAAEEEEEKEGKFPRRLWEKQAANQQITVISVEPYSKISRELPRGRNYEKVLHRILRKIWRKRKCNKKITKDKNKRHCRKRKFRSIVNSRFKNSVKIQKQCHSFKCQENSNPYRKEIPDPGGTITVVP